MTRMSKINEAQYVSIQTNIKFTAYREKKRAVWLTYFCALKIFKEKLFNKK